MFGFVVHDVRANVLIQMTPGRLTFRPGVDFPTALLEAVPTIEGMSDVSAGDCRTAFLF